MHLPLKLAGSLPVTAAALVALVIGLASPSRREMHPVLKLPNFGFAAFFAAAAALIVVVPNLLAAFAANRWAGGQVFAYCLLFVAVFAAAWWLQAGLLDRGLRQMGGFRMGADWRAWAPLVANVLLCLGAAAWFGRKGYG